MSNIDLQKEHIYIYIYIYIYISWLRFTTKNSLNQQNIALYAYKCISISKYFNYKVELKKICPDLEKTFISFIKWCQISFMQEFTSLGSLRKYKKQMTLFPISHVWSPDFDHVDPTHPHETDCLEISFHFILFCFIYIYIYTRISWKVHRLTKILSWNATKWGYFSA